MGRQKAKSNLQKVSVAVHKDDLLEAGEQAARYSRAHLRPGETMQDQLRRIVRIGVRVVRACLTCSSGVNCELHSDKALGLIEATKEAVSGADSERENIKLSDKWIAHWLRLYGKPHEKEAGKLDKCPLTIVHFKAIADARRVHGYQRLREAIDGVFSSEWHTRRARPSLAAVMNDPAKYAALLVETAGGNSGGTLQAGPDMWSGEV